MSARSPVVVAQAGDAVEAAIWVDALRDAGIEAGSFERGVGAALGGAATPGWAVYPVLVAMDSLEAARSVIAELGGAAALSRWPDDPSGAPAARSRRAFRLAAIAVAAVFLFSLLARVLTQ
ncbi:MAG: hypothetical protein ACR2HN_13615 [Tepidiformaceae bacterium]